MFGFVVDNIYRLVEHVYVCHFGLHRSYRKIHFPSCCFMAENIVWDGQSRILNIDALQIISFITKTRFHRMQNERRWENETVSEMS